jgi:hypothetical protein
MIRVFSMIKLRFANVTKIFKNITDESYLFYYIKFLKIFSIESKLLLRYLIDVDVKPK